MAKKNTSYFLYGWHAVIAACRNPQRTKHHLYCTKETHNKIPKGINAPISIEDNSRLTKRLPPHAVHQGIALHTEILEQPILEDHLFNSTAKKLYVILDQVTDPHNIGAIIRSSAAFHASGVIVQDRNTPKETPVLCKTASGAFEHIPYIPVTNIARTIELLSSEYFECYAFDSGHEHMFSKPSMNNVALVFGAEGKGVRPLVKQRCDHIVKLPTNPIFPSLNVSNAAAVALSISAL